MNGPQQLTVLLAENVMGWTVAPGRFLLGNRRWMSRWRFEPTKRVEDAFRLLDRAAPEEFSMAIGPDRRFVVKVRIAGAIGEALESSKAQAITFALARSLGLKV